MPTPFSRQRAFSLVEMAVVLAILGLLLVTAMYTLQAQQAQRAFDETQRRLEQAREAILGYAVANGRLPCPANGATGVQSEATAGAGDCTPSFIGFLPAATLGIQPVDSSGFALDAWNNRIRYAVAQSITGCSGTSTTPHFTSKTNLKANGMSCRPSDNQLLICKSTQSSPAPAVGSCGPADNVVTNQGTVVVVIFSTGPNFLTATGTRPDEAENTDGDTLFISHTPQPEGATGGEFDDMMVWIPVGTLYGRLASAGLLP
ncbi:MAG TPA: type II secretion system protein [Burkholderiales bacterium]|nr:type II secretion system protein [Burkholderiales bacterium]